MDDAQHLLAQALDFNEDDLAANRAGFLTERQHVVLRARWATRLKKEVLTIAGVGGGVALFLTLVIAGNGGGWVFLLWALGVAAVTLLVMWYWVNEYRGLFLRHDLTESTVAELRGRVKMDVHTSRDDVRYVLTIQREWFFVPKAVFFGFQHQRAYAVYYAPRTRVLLSAEPLEDIGGENFVVLDDDKAKFKRDEGA